jgi:hypothetical protein
LEASIQAEIKLRGAPVVGPANYTIDAQSFLVGAAPQTNCSPSDLQSSQASSGALLLATSGMNLTATTLDFTGCKASQPIKDG